MKKNHCHIHVHLEYKVNNYEVTHYEYLLNYFIIAIISQFPEL